MRGSEHFCQKVKREAGTCQKRRQVSVEHLVRQKRTALLQYFHCSLLLKRPLVGLEQDCRDMGAGDGARTRDSLLGRQGVTKSTLVCYEVA